MSVIFTKIPAVMKDIEAIGKDRKNDSQGFKFRGIDDIYNELHTKLAKHGVFTVPEVLENIREERPTKSGGVMTYSIMKIKFTFFAEDGSSVSAVMIGEGSDTGDKASNKAQSIAHKYAFLQVFAIPTEDEKDPDQSSPEFAPRQVSRPTAPAPKDNVSQIKPSEAGEYVIRCGFLKGQKIKDAHPEELEKTLAFYGNNPRSQDAQDLVKYGREYLGRGA
jgi:hypothetical protein